MKRQTQRLRDQESEKLFKNAVRLLNWEKPSPDTPRKFEKLKKDDTTARKKNPAAFLREEFLPLTPGDIKAREKLTPSQKHRLEQVEEDAKSRFIGDSYRERALRERDRLISGQSEYFRELVQPARQKIERASKKRIQAVLELALVRIRHLLIRASMESWLGHEGYLTPRATPRYIEIEEDNCTKFPVNDYVSIKDTTAKQFHLNLPQGIKPCDTSFPGLLDILVTFGVRLGILPDLLFTQPIAVFLAVEDTIWRQSSNKRIRTTTWIEHDSREKADLQTVLSAFVLHANQKTPWAIGFCWNCGLFFVYRREGGKPGRACPCNPITGEKSRACDEALRRYWRAKTQKKSKEYKPRKNSDSLKRKSVSTRKKRVSEGHATARKNTQKRR